MAKCLHQLIGPTNVRKTNNKKEKGKEEVTTLEKLDSIKPIFVCVSEHQKAFNTLKIALTIGPVLVYPNFNRDFILETDASLRGLGAVLSQVDDTSKVYVIAYGSWTLRPS